jgi:hypothetical protein
MKIRKNFPHVSRTNLSGTALRKIWLATKAQRHEVEKMLRIFPLCLRGFVAKLFFCKKIFSH